MVEGGGAVVFPVVFYDGEREINIGNVRIHPSLEYKTLQSILSQKIGISANQITIYLVEGKKSKFSLEDHRKILITGKANFAVIARGKDCFFLVVLKRSRRDRRRKQKHSTVELGEYLPENTFSSSQWPENTFSSSQWPENTFSSSQWPENMLLLRRNQPDLNNSQLSGYGSPYYNQISQAEFANLNDRLQKLLISRENYTTRISNTNYDSNVHLGLDSFPRIEDSYSVSTPKKPYNRQRFCKECTSVNNKEEFHFCVNDPITVGFRSPAGPITPPSKSSQ